MQVRPLAMPAKVSSANDGDSLTYSLLDTRVFKINDAGMITGCCGDFGFHGRSH